jgi:hypothetical protein
MSDLRIQLALSSLLSEGGVIYLARLAIPR